MGEWFRPLVCQHGAPQHPNLLVKGPAKHTQKKISHNTIHDMWIFLGKLYLRFMLLKNAFIAWLHSDLSVNLFCIYIYLVFLLCHLPHIVAHKSSLLTVPLMPSKFQYWVFNAMVHTRISFLLSKNCRLFLLDFTKLFSHCFEFVKERKIYCEHIPLTPFKIFK